MIFSEGDKFKCQNNASQCCLRSAFISQRDPNDGTSRLILRGAAAVAASYALQELEHAQGVYARCFGNTVGVFLHCSVVSRTPLFEFRIALRESVSKYQNFPLLFFLASAESHATRLQQCTTPYTCNTLPCCAAAASHRKHHVSPVARH